MTVNEALALAKKYHEGQVDKNGVPYWTHPYAVMNYLPEGSPDEVKIAALFHDVLEDCPVTEDDLREAGVPEYSIELVKILTHIKHESHDKYVWDIKNSGNKDAVAIKMADIKHNTLPERLATLPEALKERIVTKYKKAVEIFNS